MERFTNLYQVIKTLRFKLKSIPETEKWMEEFGCVFTPNRSISSEDKDNFFLTDLNIIMAKKVIIKVLNEIHENIITSTLTSETIKKVDITNYYQGNENEKETYVSELRNTLKTCFLDEIKRFNQKVSEKVKCKDIASNKPEDIVGGLSRKEIRKYIEMEADKYASKDLKKETIEDACKNIYKYWGVLSQFLKNRENYYEFDKEQDTAVATRIVSDLLPSFCLNASLYQNRQAEYDGMYAQLESLGIIMQIKNPIKGIMEKIDSFDASIYNPSNFSMFITQKGIDKYNAIRAKNNEIVNLFNQNYGKDKKERLKPFVKLHKQIGCKSSYSHERLVILRDWPGDVQNQEGLSFASVLKMVIEATDKMLFTNEVNYSEPRLANILNYLETCENWEGIYINDKALSTISTRYIDDWYALQNMLIHEKSVGSYYPQKEFNEQYKLNKTIELSVVFDALDRMGGSQVFKKRIYEDKTYSDVLRTDDSPSRKLVNLMCLDVKNMLRNEYAKHKQAVKKILDGKKVEGVFQKEENIDNIRGMMDSLKYVMRFVKFFAINLDKVKGSPCDTEMLQIVSSLLDKDTFDWFGLYDEVRNYVCRQPQDEVKDNKMKLNFNSDQLLGGWHVNKTKDRLALILINEKQPYLCILKNGSPNNTLFDYNEENPIYVESGNAYRMLFNPMDFRTLLRKYKPFMRESDEKFDTNYSDEPDEATAILRAKQMILSKWVKVYPELEDVVHKNHHDKKAFKKDIDEILQKDEYSQCEFKPIDWDLVKQYAYEGKIYVFKIHSKDYASGAIGKKDLQTIYWEDVLSGDSIHQLAANGEIFRREPVPENKPKPFKHEAGSILVNKRDKDGNIIPEKIYRVIYSRLNHLPLPQPKDSEQDKKAFEEISKKAQWLIDNEKIIIKTAKYAITKNARFYGNAKYFLHNPLKMNYKAKEYTNIKISNDNAYYVENPKIQEWMHEDRYKPYFIGIDRGEKNLIYSCKLDASGTIISCNNYNVINGFNYLDKLKDRAEARIDAKRDWKQEDGIKNLKNGYISQVVHSIVEEAIVLNDANIAPSYIILEKLPRQMKDSRRKIDFQVYQKIELALAKKLGFYVNKDIEKGLPGSIKKPLQFVPPVNNFDQIDKKDSFGIMLYTRPNYTSITDPATGWRQTIYINSGNDEIIYKQIIELFDDIFFDGKDYVFRYTERSANHQWDLFSSIDGKSLDRFEYNNSTKGYDAYNIVSVLNGLFKGFDMSRSLLEQMRQRKPLNKVEKNKTAYESLRKAIKMIQQIRNSGNRPKDDNFLQSPVRKEGKHFDTRKANEFRNLHFIVDADANGAYNIAKKGMIMNEHYRYWVSQGKPTIRKDSKDIPALSWYVSDREWDMWLLNKKLWEEHLKEFAIRVQ